MTLAPRRWRFLPAHVLAVSALTLATLAPGGTAHAAPPEGSIRQAGGATAIADSYLVVLKGAQRGDAKRMGDALTTRYGGSVRRVFTRALNGYSAQLSARAARRLAADPAVAYVTQNHRIQVQGTQVNPPSWGLDRVDQDTLPLNKSYTYPNQGAALRAYIIDTGIRAGHADFGGRASTGIDLVDGGAADDCNGHGTHVAGTIGGATHGVAKSVDLVSVRVFDCSGGTSSDTVIAAVDWVTANAVKPAVVNMSLGGGGIDALDAAVRTSIASGLTYAIAAGNDSADACSTSPARVSAAITVAASENNDASAPYTNRGGCVDLYAPGSGIQSAWYTGNTATAVLSGTSMATPHVAGVAALYLSQNPTWSPAQVQTAIVDASIPDAISAVSGGTPNQLLHVGASLAPPADDFDLSVGPENGEVVAGATVSTTVTTTALRGAPGPITLSVTGLRPGITARILPGTVQPGQSATLTITTTDAAPAFESTSLRVRATAGTVVHSRGYLLAISKECAARNTNAAGASEYVTRQVTVAGCGRAPSRTATIRVSISAAFTAYLQMDLVAPDGTSTRLANPGYPSDGGDFTLTADLSGKPANGLWEVQIRDTFPFYGFVVYNVELTL